MPNRLRFRSVAMRVIAYGLAMAYLEAAVVVYLQRALEVDPEPMLPVGSSAEEGILGWVELGREAATILMLAVVGWLAGSSRLERLAWTAVAFGLWDIAYYAWLCVFIGWPPSLDTWDVLFLIPVPWVGPVWAPVTVSAALVGFGLAAARRLGAGGTLEVGAWRIAGSLAGGSLVILSFTLDAGRILAGGHPESFAWPIFLAGMTLASLAVGSAFRVTARPPGIPSTLGRS